MTSKIYADNMVYSGNHLNTAVIGCAGSGKGYHYIRPNLKNEDGSNIFLVTADKNYVEYIPEGYEITVLDFNELSSDVCYNPFHYIENEYDIRQLAHCMVTNVSRGKEKDEYFLDAWESLLCSAITYVHEKSENKTMSEVLEVLKQMYDNPGQRCDKNACLSLIVMLDLFQASTIKELMCKDAVHMDAFKNEQKQAFVIVLNRVDCSFDVIVNMIISQIKQIVLKSKCKSHLKIMLDEFSRYYICDFPEFLAVCSTYNCSVDYCLQSICQLEAIYGKQCAYDILGFSNLVFLGTCSSADCQYLAERFEEAKRKPLFHKTVGKKSMTPEKIMNLPMEKCIVFINGEKPYIQKKYTDE
jgi:type IV secretory pathway TraG/TraD family ATPase VirD4